MSKNKHINLRYCRLYTCTVMNRLFIAACVLSYLFLLAGCISERIDSEMDSGDSVATLYLNLDVPGLGSGYSYGSEPRAMSIANENSIDHDNIHILVFEEVGHDELFRYKATISAFISQRLTLKMPVSRAHERYRIVVIANADVPLIADGTPKIEALNSFVFDCAGKWNTSDASFSHIPMWGEYRQPFAIKNNTSVNVLMHRALARVDVGALFKFNNPNPVNEQEYADKDTDKESVWGLNNFKIKSIRVYRTLNKAYIASSVDKMVADEVVVPNAPASAKYNSDSGAGYDDLESADKDPLVYTLPAGSDSYIREIYVPESFPSGVSPSFGLRDAGSDAVSQFVDSSNAVRLSVGSPIVDAHAGNSSSGSRDAGSHAGNVPCIVIGGYYGENNTTRVTYYRADFATYKNGKVSAYRPLLRNHRYVFDIRGVGGPGHNEPEQAFNAITSDMTLDVKEWNEQPFNYQVQGNYFYSIDAREVTLDARPAEDEAVASRTIAYRTNLDLDPVNNPFAYEWKSFGNANSNDFDIVFDYPAKTITIKSKNDNVGIGAQPLLAQVEISIKNYRFTIDVAQKAINAAYTPDCSGAVVHGIYRKDFALNHTNYITVRITSPATLRDLEYDVRTVETNGIYFAAKGAFDTDGTYANGLYEYELNLKGYGTLINVSAVQPNFDIIIRFNSITPASCSVAIPIE